MSDEQTPQDAAPSSPVPQKAAGSSEPTEAQLMAALGRMDKRKLRAILGSPIVPVQVTPKMGPILEALSGTEIERARSGLTAAVKMLDEKGDAAGDSLELDEFLPEQLVQVMRSSSAYRGKSVAHSVRVAARWIAEKRPPRQ